jgi:alcohol dehydrogenase
MKAWKVDQLGGAFEYVDAPMPTTRPGSVLVRVEAQSLMSYLKPYVEGKLSAYRAPHDFIPGGNAIGIIEEVGRDVWHLKKGQRVVFSSHLTSRENVSEPGQILIGITSPGGVGDALQESWKDGTLAEYVLVPAETLTPLNGLERFDPKELVPITRCIVPYGGLLRGRLAAGETVAINGATGAYGSAAVFVALAMGAARVVIMGRKEEALQTLARKAGERVVPVPLRGDIVADTAAVRKAAAGGVHLAFDMVGGTSDANSTLAALGALQRAGRLVLMGSSSVPIPINYLQVMLNSLEIIGNFMYPKTAYVGLLELVRSGQLDLSIFQRRIFPLAQLPQAMDQAGKAESLEIVVAI